MKAAAVVLGAVALWKLFGCHCDCKCQSSASGGCCKKAKPAGCCKGKRANDTGKTQIVCAEAAQPIAPYSQAIKANGMIFVSGMVGLTKVCWLCCARARCCARLCCAGVGCVVHGRAGVLCTVCTIVLWHVALQATVVTHLRLPAGTHRVLHRTA